MKPHFLALTLAALSAIPATAQTTSSTDAPPAAQNIMASNPQDIAAKLQDFGYRTELTKDEQGDPKIKSSAGGANFSVYFYGCDNNVDCTSIQLSAGFDLDAGTTLEVINEWNAGKRYGKVYLDDEKDPYIEMDIELEGAGIPVETFRMNMETWDKIVADFQTHIDW